MSDTEKLGKEYDLTFIDWDPTLTFNLQEACSLMCREIVRNEDAHLLPKPPIMKSGNIVGVLAVNDEIELVIRFPEGMDQVTKTEFCGDYKLVPDGN